MYRSTPSYSLSKQCSPIFLLCVRITLLFALVCSSAQANPLLGSAPAKTPTVNETLPDPLGRESPKGTVTGYIEAMSQGNLDKAIGYFNLSHIAKNQREERGKQLAENLKTLLDNNGSITTRALLSEDAVGDTKDGLQNNLDKVGSFKYEEREVKLLLEHTNSANEQPIWLFSSATLEQIPLELKLKPKTSSIETWMPQVLQKYKWGGASVGQWLFMLVLAAAAFLLAKIITIFNIKLVHIALKDKLTKKRHYRLVDAFALPIQLYASVWILVLSAKYLGISILIREYFSQATTLVAWVAILILLWRLIDVFGLFAEKRMHRHKNQGGLSAVIFFKRCAKLGIGILGVITTLKLVGIDITTGLAALGIGGIALALGAQKTVENLVGSLNVIFDQPVRVGDFCQVGDIVGTIEEIGMRSTRIRTLARTLVTIPNGDFSAQTIENYSHRDSFLYRPTIGLRYETSPDQMRFVLVKIREMLYSHPRIDPEPARVRFIQFGASSQDIEILAYIHAADYHESLEVQEDLNLRIAEIIEASGTSFAFPSQTVYLSQDEGLSSDKTERAQQQVEQWRKQKALHIPKFDELSREKLRATLNYPEQGSSTQPDGSTKN